MASADERDEFDEAIRAHDALLATHGFDIWVGTEPTFTDRFANDPQWLSAALGEDKLARAEQLLVRLAGAAPGAAVLRSVGRCYPGEATPRWSFGLLATRDGTSVWQGPPDPLLCSGDLPAPDLQRFHDALVSEAMQAGFATDGLTPTEHELRLLLREPDSPPPLPHDKRLARPSCHGRRDEDSSSGDELAPDGYFLFLLSSEPTRAGPVARLELPALRSGARLRRVLALVTRAAREAELSALILAGYPPPVDAQLAWSTLTPDPAVIEINSAPFPDCAAMLGFLRRLYEEATAMALSPFRLYYNGDVGDSGGAGQITLGGPDPLASPFFRHPQVLPGWVRYVNHHPCLSYLFAHDYVGAFGQSVRSDERDREHFEELDLALRLLAGHGNPSAETLWRGLAPFLADIAGNAHRGELNIEKLWNPYLAERGQLGLLEFRALRMAHTPERLVAIGALLRAITARLAAESFTAPLMDWNEQLHDRFALPFCLREDLRTVLADLERCGFGLTGPIKQALFEDSFRVLGRVEFEGVKLSVRRAMEFWPLVGDAANQDRGTSRLVDASTTRIELRLRAVAAGNDHDFDGWAMALECGALPLRRSADDLGPAFVLGLRYRRYAPTTDLHPGLPVQGPIALLLWHPARSHACRVTIHEWRPDQLPYDGLPADEDDATLRRAERIVVEHVAKPPGLPPPLPAHAATRWCLDLRRL